MSKQIFTAKASDRSKLKQAFRELYDQIEARLTDKSKTFKIEAKEQYKGARYRRYFGYVVRPIFESKILEVAAVHGDVLWTLTYENVHEYLKLVYCGIEVVDKTTGEMQVISRSTKELDDYNFIATYEEKIKADFAQRGVIFPELPSLDEMAESDSEFYMMINQ